MRSLQINKISNNNNKEIRNKNYKSITVNYYCCLKNKFNKKKYIAINKIRFLLQILNQKLYEKEEVYLFNNNKTNTKVPYDSIQLIALDYITLHAKIQYYIIVYFKSV